MDDQQGNLIDGTARARQWRRSRARSSAATDGVEQHSDAPKSIASSLLVPAEMPGLETANIQAATDDAIDRRPREARRSAAEHVNPFLVSGLEEGTFTSGGSLLRRRSASRTPGAKRRGIGFAARIIR